MITLREVYNLENHWWYEGKCKNNYRSFDIDARSHNDCHYWLWGHIPWWVLFWDLGVAQKCQWYWVSPNERVVLSRNNGSPVLFCEQNSAEFTDRWHCVGTNVYGALRCNKAAIIFSTMMLNVLWTYWEVLGAKAGLNSLGSDLSSFIRHYQWFPTSKIPILIS